MAEQCSFRVYGGRDMRGHLCVKPAKKQSADGKWLCSCHLPEAIAKREAAFQQRCKEESERIGERHRREEEMRQRAAEWPQLKQRIAELEAEVAAFRGKNYPEVAQVDFAQLLVREPRPFQSNLGKPLEK